MGKSSLPPTLSLPPLQPWDDYWAVALVFSPRFVAEPRTPAAASHCQVPVQEKHDVPSQEAVLQL